MRFVVLGANGQLGRDLVPRLPGTVVPLARDRADLTRPDALRAALDEARPDAVVNCAAYNFVDRAEAEPDAAFAVNAWGVRALATLCGQRGWLLVHYSTDHVFGLDSRRRTPWTETDAPGPVSVYGLSKLAGEYLARALCPRHLVVRTCGLYGLHGGGGKGGNFVETMLRVAGQGKPLRVVDDQVCTPTYTVDLAEATVRLLGAGATGLFHLTGGGACSWHEFARGVFRAAGVAADLAPIRSADWAAAARRPAYSVLAPTAYAALGLPPLRHWAEALAAYLAERAGRAAAALPPPPQKR
jgi:dTDP-4-dehydrorhamnose reductase